MREIVHATWYHQMHFDKKKKKKTEKKKRNETDPSSFGATDYKKAYQIFN